MLNQERPRKIDFFLMPVSSLVLAYFLFPLALDFVHWAIYNQTSWPAQIWVIRRQHGCIEETHLGPMFIIASFLVTMVAATGIVYTTRYFLSLAVLAQQIAAYEADHKLGRAQAALERCKGG